MISPRLLEQIEQLTLDEKLRLMEILIESIREKLKDAEVKHLRDKGTPIDKMTEELDDES